MHVELVLGLVAAFDGGFEVGLGGDDAGPFDRVVVPRELVVEVGEQLARLDGVALAKPAECLRLVADPNGKRVLGCHVLPRLDLGADDE